MRPIIADTEEKTWAKAGVILERAIALQDVTGYRKPAGANSNTTALVGTPEQVAEVFRDNYGLGVSHFLIRGFDPLIDAIEYDRELIRAIRRLIAEL